MDTYKTIISKRDTRSFTEQAVSEESARRIVQAGRMAGSSKNVQPCRFIIIDDQKVKAEIAKCGDFAAWIPTAPLIVAIATTDTGTRNEFDAGRAAQNMMVAAWGEEIGSVPGEHAPRRVCPRHAGAAGVLAGADCRGVRVPGEGAEVGTTGGASAVGRLRPPQPLVAGMFLITGSGRSGTSAVAQLLHAAGIAVGNDLIEPDEHNAEGYFEERMLVMINDAILNAAGIGDPFTTATRAAIIDASQEYLDHMVALTDGATPAWKDPRLC